MEVKNLLITENIYKNERVYQLARIYMILSAYSIVTTDEIFKDKWIEISSSIFNDLHSLELYERNNINENINKYFIQLQKIIDNENEKYDNDLLSLAYKTLHYNYNPFTLNDER